MKKGDKVIIVAKVASKKRPNAFKFNLKDKVKIQELKDEGYIVIKEKKESFVIDCEITPEKCSLTEHEFNLIIQSLWRTPPYIDGKLELANRLEKVYYSGIKSIQLDTTSIRGIDKLASIYNLGQEGI